MKIRYPLTPTQHGMLMHSLRSPRDGTYVQQMVCTLREALNVECLETAWQCVVDRHAVLRTGFHFADGDMPVQEVVPRLSCRIERRDWRGAGTAESEQRLDAYLRLDRRQPFALERAPLWRLWLFRLAEHDYRLVWTSHHALLDGRSRRLLLEEIFTLYDARCQGVEPHLEEPHPFERYVRWLAAQPSDESRDYWRGFLEGFTRATPLPMDHVARTNLQPEHDDSHKTLELLLTEDETAALRGLAHAQQVTFNTLLQGAWALLLSRYAGTEDVVFGATRACRGTPVEGVHSMVGLLINTAPIRVAVPASTTLASWLQGLRSQWIAMREHEQTPLTKIQGWSDLPPGEPLFESIVVFENFGLDEALREKGSAWASRSFRLIGTTNYPLVVSGHFGPRLVIELTYDRHRFDDDTVSRMRAHLQNLLDAFASHPECRLSEITLLTAAERQQLLGVWSGRVTEYPRNRSIKDLFEEQVARDADAVAVEYQGRRLSYGELNARANRLAHHLRTLGVGPEVRVGLCLERSLEMVVGILGILKAGGAYVPLDPGYPGPRLAMMLEDTAAPVLLSESGLRDRLPSFAGKVICLDTDWPEIATQPETNPQVEVGGSNLAYVMYTSGSTGRPKGTCIEQRSVVRLVKNANYIAMGPKEVFLQFSPISFDASTLELWGSLLNGGKLLVCPAGRVSMAELGKIIREGGVSTLWLTAGLFNLMVDEQLDNLRGVRQILAGGEALSVVHVRRLLQVIGEGRFVNGYGPTENTTFTCCHVMDAQSRIGQSVPIGKPITNTRVYILDEWRQPVPIGVAGELYVGGDGLAREYLNQPELTAEKFVADPFGDEPGTRLYRTGDLVRWRLDGDLEFLGRLDHQIKLRGFRIEPGEIELELAQQPKVQQAVVILREDRPGERRLVAYVVAECSGTPPAATDLRRFLQAKLPDYMVPSTFVILDELPLSPNGKLDRRRLPAPDPGRLDGDRVFVAPRTATEESVGLILANLLGRNRVGVHDDFFELGGDSLLAIQAASRIRQALGGELPLTCLFETPTLAGLVGHLGTRDQTDGGPGAPALVATPGTGASPLSCSQLSIWNLHQSYPDRVMSNTCRAHRLKGRLFPEAVRDALQCLLERHEALRTNFATVGGAPMQVVVAAVRLEFPVIDLSGLPESQRLAEAQRLYQDEKQRRYNLAQDTMLRAMLIRLDADDHVLVLNLSHIVSDARSMAILYREFPLLYDAFSRGKRIALPPLPIQPRDFARWEQRYLQGGVLERQVAFWTKHLSCRGWAADPLSHAPGSASRDYASLRQSLVVANTFVDELQEVGRQEGCTLAMTLFALTNVLLHKFTGCEDILMGAPFAARTRPEIDELIGCFRKRVILRTDLSGRPTFREVLRRVRDVWRAAFLHQDVSLELVFPGREPDHPQHWTRVPSFNFMDRSAHALELPGLNLTHLPLSVWFPATSFNLHLIQGKHDLDLVLYFRRALYSAATIRDFLNEFRTLVERLAVAPDERLASAANRTNGSDHTESAASSHG